MRATFLPLTDALNLALVARRLVARVPDRVGAEKQSPPGSLASDADEELLNAQELLALDLKVAIYRRLPDLVDAGERYSAADDLRVAVGVRAVQFDGQRAHAQACVVSAPALGDPTVSVFECVLTGSGRGWVVADLVEVWSYRGPVDLATLASRYPL